MITIEELKHEILKDDFILFKEKIKEFDIKEYDKFGNNILHYFVKNSKSIKFQSDELLLLFLSRGIDINAPQMKGDKRTALMLSVVMRNKPLVELLLDNGANVNSQDNYGNNALLIALLLYREPSDDSVIQYLLEKGADPDLKNYSDVSSRILAEDTTDCDLKRFFENY